MKVCVLTSGGIDSAACIAYFLSRGNIVAALCADYGQPAARAEVESAAQIAAHFGVPLMEVRLEGIPWHGEGEPREYPARNLTLVALAMNAYQENGLIALGIHAGSRFPDCTEEFVERLDALTSFLSDGRIRFDCPFVAWSKLDVARWAHAVGIPWHLTYSCERGTTPPCEECAKCRETAEIMNALHAA